MVIIYYIRNEEIEYNVHGFVDMDLVVEEPWWQGGGGVVLCKSSLGL